MIKFLNSIRQTLISSFEPVASAEKGFAAERLIQTVFESDIPTFLGAIGVYLFLCFLLQFARKVFAFTNYLWKEASHFIWLENHKG